MTTEMLFGVGVFIFVVAFTAGYIAGYRERGEQ